MTLQLVFWVAAAINMSVPKIETRPSIGPHKNIIETMMLPPSVTFAGDGSDEQERCMTVALAFGLGGAPMVLHSPQSVTIVSLLPKTFGLVSTMVTIRSDKTVEIRGYQDLELRMIRQCLK